MTGPVDIGPLGAGPAARPGAAEAGPAHCVGDVCITCSDEAVPVRITELRRDELALVATEAGTFEEVSIALVDAGVGDVVLVHAKEAIARVDASAFRPAGAR
ncbi:MAG TPA: HypC/HybG/HupF family hydrogenase formation chaperone [Pseudonocardia sp.]|jgi:hydrogenase expression/formation protein HypC|nr:HypC/HybG/HupF family hydrogenase formation chaperone [Pseudonocardia sp.]